MTLSSGSSPASSRFPDASESERWWRQHDRPYTEGEHRVGCLIGVHAFVEWQRDREEYLLAVQRSPEQVRRDRLRQRLGQRISDVIGQHWHTFAPVLEDIVDGVWDTSAEEYRQRAAEVTNAE